MVEKYIEGGSREGRDILFQNLVLKALSLSLSFLYETGHRMSSLIRMF